MAVLTTISGIPLYTTIQEALDWATSVGLTGYHTHQYQGITGYMGGSDHNNAITGNTASMPSTTASQSSTTSSSSGSGSGGGY